MTMITSTTDYSPSERPLASPVALLNALPDHAAVLNRAGTIIAVNSNWENTTEMIGRLYLPAARELAGFSQTDQGALAEGLQKVGEGSVNQFALDIHCPSRGEHHWCRIRATRIDSDPPSLLVIHENISAWKSSETALKKGVRERDAELQRAHVLQAQLTDYLPNGVIYLASDGSLIGANRHGAESLHMSIDELKKRKLSDFAGMVTHEDGTPCPVADFPASRCIATGQPQPSELIGVLQPDGSRQWLLVAAVPAPCPIHPGRMGAVATFSDLTERKKVEEALREAQQDLELRVAVRTEELQHANDQLRESEARFRQMAENIGEVIYIFNVETRTLLYLSPTYEKLYGRRVSEMMEDWQSFTQAVVPEDVGRVRESLHTRFHDPVDTVYRIHNGSGELRWLRSRAFPIRDSKGKIYRVTGIVEDITDIKLAQEQLSRLQHEVLAVTERERRRIGQDLHDGLGQHLTGIAFLSKSLQQRLTAKANGQAAVTDSEAAEAVTIAELVQSAIAQSRALARGLHPVEPVPTGLMAALQELTARTAAVFNTACSFDCCCRILIYDDAKANNLYRIAQEAVNNAVKYANSRHISVSLQCVDGRTVLSIVDDGIGIPPSEQRGSGMGLRIMHYRAEMIGATLSITKGTDGGTEVRCMLPAEVRVEKDEQ